jgi:hypothetical protein
VRAFDVWERDRTRYGADLDFMPGDRWSFGLGYSNWKDEFPGAVATITPFGYGLERTESDSVYGTVGCAAARFNVTATLGRDTSRWDSLSVTKSSLSGTSYVANNRWSRTQDDTVDWANVYFDILLVRDRLRLFADLTYSAYDGSLETTNEDVPDINSAVAYPFPDFRNDLFSGRLALRWTLTPRIDIEARYWYEPFRLDDFMWDDLQPYPQGTILEARSTPADIQAANVERLLLLDDRYSDYTANIVAAVVRAHF